jgi:hypothetical protein
MADYPGYSSTRQNPGSTRVSGRGGSGADPTAEPGQYPPGSDHGIFGGPLPAGTGAPGTASSHGGMPDPTNQPGQTQDGLTGVSEHDITSTGASGTQGTTPTNGGGPDTITFTRPQAGLTPFEDVTISDSVGGPADWTQANDDGYGSGGPQLPGIQGNEPGAGSGRFQPGSGRVLRGGRAVRG